MDNLYDRDILAWSEQQAWLVRQHATGRRTNDAEIDWPNIAEEIESVGREQLHAVESLFTQAIIHMLKAEAWPLSRGAPSWRAETLRFRADARRRFTLSMRQKIDLAGLYADALRALPEKLDGQAPLPVPELCPVTLDELLASL